MRLLTAALWKARVVVYNKKVDVVGGTQWWRRCQSPMRVELIETEDALRALEPVWESLWRADPAADVFTSFDWFLNWWEHFGHGRGSYGLVMRDGDRWVSLPGRDTRLHVLVVWDQGEALAIAPLLLLHGWWQRCPVRILAPPLNNHAPRSGFLMSRASRAAVAAVVEYLARSRQWDLMLLDGIPGQSGLVPTLSEVAARRLRPGQRQLPWFHAYLAVEGTWEQYLKQKSENFRRSLRRAERALAQLGTVTVEQYEGLDTVQTTGMPAFMEIDRESWKARDGESIALHSHLGAYYGALATQFAKKNQCEIWTLSIANEPAAAFLCLCDGRVLYILKSSYKDKFGSSQLSPSFVLMARIVQDVWRRKLSGIDCVGQVPFLERWTPERLEFDRLVVFGHHLYPGCVQLVDRLTRRVGKAKRFLRGWLR